MKPLALLLLFVLAFVLAVPGWSQRVEGPAARTKRLVDRAALARHVPSGSRPPTANGLPALRAARLPTIVMTGYWPPSNEALRRFSDDPVKNPLGWVGADWEGRGYNVYAYFPEFANPSCAACGKGRGDLQVDYQETAADFRPLVERRAPLGVITFSRGFDDMSWEVEMNQFNRTSWIADFCSPYMPTPSPPDPSAPAQSLRLSKLPVQDIVDAVDGAGLGLDAYVCFTGNGGGFLSEFIAYQGVWYQSDRRSPTYEDWCITAGHVHVGGRIAWSTAAEAVEITLREVIAEIDSVVADTVCQPDLGGGGPGRAELRVCGGALSTGEKADLLLTGAPSGAPAVLLVGLARNPTPWKGGVVVPVPAAYTQALPIDADGEGLIEGLPGGSGPFTVYAQVVYQGAAQAQGWGFSNVVQVDFLP